MTLQGETLVIEQELDSISLSRLDSLNTLLTETVRRCDFFSSDETDEFQITREGGQDQGIFKVWATPIIPVLDTGEMDVDKAIERWTDDVKKNPLSLFQSLEQWRAFSAIADRRLQQIFDLREIPEDPQEVIAEFFSRLIVAFRFGAPFYNVEALVADTRESKIGNPIDFEQEKSHGGKLDAVAMMLPAALKDQIVSEQLNWNGLSWSAIEKQFVTMRETFLQDEETVPAKQFILVSKIAELAGVDPQEVIFAANALEFIPADVGGKSNDLSQNEAIAALTNLLEQPGEKVTSNLIAKDINALIRFLNWCPVIRSDENFTGKFWSYEAVCGTSSRLVEALKTNPSAAFEPEFAPVFTEQLVPQLDGVDATSAKGRFMLQLLDEGRFNSVLESKIASQTEQLNQEAIRSLKEFADEEALIDIGSQAPIFLTGGKANGLRKARWLFGGQTVEGGKILTSERIDAWFNNVDGFNSLVGLLESSEQIDEKISIGEEIAFRINSGQVPVDLVSRIRDIFEADAKIVLRSSSFDEDVDIIGPAPGVYESVVDIDASNEQEIEAGLKRVVSSFFSDRAISFRELKGLRHKPIFAVIVQKFVGGPSGSVFIQNGEMKLNIAPSPNKVNGSDEKHLIEELVLSSETEISEQFSNLISLHQFHKIARLAKKAEAIFGPSDIEFAIDPNTNQVKILQLRTLERPKIDLTSEENMEDLTTIRVDSLENLPDLNGSRDINLQIAAAIDLEKFQGSLFRWIIAHGSSIKMISLEKAIPSTCHFANIVESLGIALS